MHPLPNPRVTPLFNPSLFEPYISHAKRVYTPHPKQPPHRSQLGRSRGVDVDALAAARVLTVLKSRSNRGERRHAAKSTTNYAFILFATGTTRGTGISDTATRTVSVTARRFRATFRASNRRGAGGGDGANISLTSSSPPSFPSKSGNIALALLNFLSGAASAAPVRRGR